MLLGLAGCGGCVSVEPRPVQFGDVLTLGSDCKELVGKYHNRAEFPGGYLQLTDAISLDASLKRELATSVSLAFGADGALTIAAHDIQDAVLASRAFARGSQHVCEEGVLRMSFGAREYGPFPAMGFLGRNTFELMRSSDRHLLVRTWRSGVSYFLVLPMPIHNEHWFVFAPR